ncbi:inositol polyphosphate 5-phosphatase ocrl-1 isoform x2 [Stylonychia lemnae]|uniref:Inositol polyphosphate 5-phosphatase ocrl-1 isoform x2 n=1 Tax=Stylonychia lemnae TaxID=5949 RepID=A0A078APA4_STYLE|nr:inositol polyphosphate 5-phosphatase ocrl-1 isoform x2 [Stylonychia lemnae]|eukprot:CDW83152.1 inositol polyphosphate 5-phosphatase ocrl-1 isoform x2 [Stylonychia lemnae]
MIEGMMEILQQQPTPQQKKNEVACTVALVSNLENLNQFALVFIAKKSKKIELIMPITIEFQQSILDRIQTHQNSPVQIIQAQIPSTATFKVRVLSNHAGEKRNLMERIQSIRQFLPRESNTFAIQKTHAWLWHYSTLIPKIIQTKPVGQEKVEAIDIALKNQESKEEKLKETIDQIKSSNKYMSQIAMDIFFKQEFEKRQSQYMIEHGLKIFVVTWNVNGQKPPCDEVEDIFTARNVYLDQRYLEINELDDIPDLMVFNFQEIVPLNAKSMILSGQLSQPQLWEKYLIQEYNTYFQKRFEGKLPIPNIQYVDKIASHGQVGLYQVVLFRKDKINLISEVQLAQVGTGILGVGGNKGAIGCSIKICETKIAVINAHLAASQSKVQRRNQNVTQILKSLQFIDKHNDKQNLFEHDILLWCGDLNYRINSDNFNEVVDMIQQNKLYELRNLDQLKQEKAAGNVFGEFEEGKIKFPPTYKFKVGTNDYDSDKVRIPSWCDRILYRGETLYQQFYTSVASPTTSDHKPVCALFKATYKEIDPVQQQIVAQTILDYLKNLKDNFIPKMKLSTTEVVFENVRYGDTQFVIMEVENTGDGLLEYEITKLQERDNISLRGSQTAEMLKKKTQHSAWLSINPLRGVVKAGETKQITFRIQINQREAQLLFLDKDLEEFIQIKTNEPDVLTKNQVIHVQCKYLSSCFGAALSILNQCTGKDNLSIRDELQQINFEDVFLCMQSRRLNQFTLPLPKELHRLATYILQEGKLKPNIFLNSGNAAQAKIVREKIDTNQDLKVDDNDDPYTVASVMIDFLSTLLTPILPQILYRLPKDNSMAFVYIVSFFKEMLNYSDKNKLNPEKICELLSECLIGEDKLNQSTKFRREQSLVRAAPKKSPTKTGRDLEHPSIVRPNTMAMHSATGVQRTNTKEFQGGTFTAHPQTQTYSNLEEDDELLEFNNDLQGVEENKDPKLSIEQAKSKLRYQGLLLHLFQ